MVTWPGEIRHAFRVLWREPRFSVPAVIALTLGIGATTAIFTVFASVLLRPLPYRDPDRLVVALHGPTASGPVSPADYFDYRKDARSFSGLAAAQAWSGTLGDGSRPERVAGLRVSSHLFDLLGVRPLIGRTFARADERAPGENVVVISHRLWQRRFGGDRAVVGRSIRIDEAAFIVVGVMPPTFRFAPFWQTRADMWAPLSLAQRLDDRGGRSLRLFGRLRETVGVAQAQAEMTAIAARLERAYPRTNTGIAITVLPLHEKVVGGVRPTLLALMGMVAFVLLIACVNVANALLSRSALQQKEIGVRMALGAGRWLVIRRMLTDSLLLAFGGSVVGLALAWGALTWLMATLPPASLPRQEEVAIDWRVFALACVVGLVTAVATAVGPAVYAFRGGLSGVLAAGKGATEGRTRKRMRAVLVSAQVALAVMLLAGAGLMARTMINLAAIDPGFDTNRLAVATISLAGTAHTAPAARTLAFDRVRARLARVPGVEHVSSINHLPLAGDVWRLDYAIVGHPPASPGSAPGAVYRIVQPGYFTTMGVPLIAGRDISPDDHASALPVAVINKALADRHWPGQSPIGQAIRVPGTSKMETPLTIVGVAVNTRQSDWTGAPDAEVYLPYAQRAGEFGLTSMTFVLRTSVDAAAIAAAVPGEVGLVDSRITVFDSVTMQRVVGDELWRERLTAALTGALAAVALALAAIGIYAVVSYSVARRTREFGVRVALGAMRSSITSLALVEALAPIAVGAGCGLLAALATSRFIRTLLYGVSESDPLAFASAMATLLVVALTAACVPALRASRLDPVTALRDE